MTTKYRRKVSDERVNMIARETEEHPATVRSVLEADAEVIEGKYAERNIYYNIINDAVEIHTFKDNKYNIFGFEKEQFHAEWEEIPND